MLSSFNKYLFLSVILLPNHVFAGDDGIYRLNNLPDELILSIAKNLPFNDVDNLSLVCNRFKALLSYNEKMKILSHQYYGCYTREHKETIKKSNIPPIPGMTINDPLSRLAYHRYQSNKYLESLKGHQRLCVATLEGHTSVVMTVTTLPDGRLVSGSSDETLKVWDLNKSDEDRCVATLEVHTSAVITVTTLPDGRLVSGSYDKTLKVWDLNKPDRDRCVATLEGHTRSQHCLTVGWCLALGTGP